MKETFQIKAIENIKMAEFAFENDCYNASANRAYYAAFHAAIVAIVSTGIEPKIDHKIIQTVFADSFFNRRKILSSKYKSYLKDLQDIRNIADYRMLSVSKKLAKQQLEKAKEFIEIIFKVII
jgi:uncharacterized protein (UPF0332 family)